MLAALVFYHRVSDGPLRVKQTHISNIDYGAMVEGVTKYLTYSRNCE